MRAGIRFPRTSILSRTILRHAGYAGGAVKARSRSLRHRTKDLPITRSRRDQSQINLLSRIFIALRSAHLPDAKGFFRRAAPRQRNSCRRIRQISEAVSFTDRPGLLM
jgi:hypothetical protein